MVFVINTSLNMSTGKIASQVAHTAVSLFSKAKSGSLIGSLFRLPNSIDVWLVSGQAKVVLKGENEDHLIRLEQKAQSIKEGKLMTAVIRDRGRTEVLPGSLTCMGIFGPVKLVDKVTGNLPLLK